VGLKRQDDAEGATIATVEIGGEHYQKVLACDIGGVVLGSVANPVQVAGPLTDDELRADPVPVAGPLTDDELRADPVPVSGTVNVGNLPGTQPVSGPVTDAEMRAAPIQVDLQNVLQALLHQIRLINRPLWMDQQSSGIWGGGALRVIIVDSVGNRGYIQVVSTVSVLSSVDKTIASPGTLDRTSWALNVRERIT
jgi:hypothetical protein